MTFISCGRLDDLFQVSSRLLHLEMEKKACQYRVLDPCAMHPPFDHVIAGSYKGSSAHNCESEMYVCSLCNQSCSIKDV